MTDNTILKELEEIRQEKMEKFSNDPFLGYSSLNDALEDYKLSSQAEVLARLLNRGNVFISGPAGSGKTTIINHFIDLINTQYSGMFEIAVTASTGIAATLIGGQTIHSWAGLGIDTEPFNRKKVSPMMWAKADKLRYTDVLIIDEISMLPAYLFEKLDKTLQFFRRNSKPFGGIQLILTGDFLQLPPVQKKTDDEDLNTDYAIVSDSWKKANIEYCYMDKTHRATDERLKYLLNRISTNRVDEITRKYIDSRSYQDIKKDKNKTYTNLYTTNQNVDFYNKEQLAKNTNVSRFFNAQAYGSKKNVEKLHKLNKIEKKLELKRGATVMLSTNIRDEELGTFYANGSMGTIISFADGIPNVRFNDGTTISIERKMYELTEKELEFDDENMQEVQVEKTVAYIMQIPLKLGYAITVHKSQGQTFDGVVVDLSKCFTEGLGYVALSRVRTLDDLIILGLHEKAYNINPRSMKIAIYVKKMAYNNRQDFIKNIEYYGKLLTDENFRDNKWDISNAGGLQLYSQ